MSGLAQERNGNLAAIKAKTDNIPAQGQALAEASTPVVLPAAQITTLTPPAAITGFATEVTIGLISTAINTATTGIHALITAMKAKVDNIPALGQALAAACWPVVLTSAQITTLTPPAAITGFATETGGNLAAIKAKTDNIPALGQAVAAAAVPCVLTALQEAALQQSYLTPRADSVGACLSGHAWSGASTNLIALKGSAGRVYQITLTNTTAAFKYIRFYNKASAPVIANDAALILASIGIPPNFTLTLDYVNGIYFSTGIAFAMTGAAGDTDATNTAANDVSANIQYI